jgi:hypothetical protein
LLPCSDTKEVRKIDGNEGWSWRGGFNGKKNSAKNSIRRSKERKRESENGSARERAEGENKKNSPFFFFLFQKSRFEISL